MKQVDGESIAESLDDFRYAWTQSFSTDEALAAIQYQIPIVS